MGIVRDVKSQGKSAFKMGLGFAVGAVILVPLLQWIVNKVMGMTKTKVS